MMLFLPLLKILVLLELDIVSILSADVADETLPLYLSV